MTRTNKRMSEQGLAECLSSNSYLRIKGSASHQKRRTPSGAPSPAQDAPVASKARKGKDSNDQPGSESIYFHVPGALRHWAQEEIALLKEFYPSHGKLFCAAMLGRGEGSVRWMASTLGLRVDTTSEFYKEWQQRAAQSKVGKKRPDQADVMRRLHSEGKLTKNDAQRDAIGVRMREWIRVNGHPRGALGMKHNLASLAKISEASKRTWDAMSPEQRAAQTEKGLRTKIARGISVQPRPQASWRCGWREIGGVSKYYRSRWEANYARYLEWLKSIGQIASWAHEPKTFWFDKIRRGCRSYLPDFLVVEITGAESYHEVKGWMDARSFTKIKRMELYYPSVTLIVIDAKQYRALQKQVKAFVPGWEAGG